MSDLEQKDAELYPLQEGEMGAGGLLPGHHHHVWTNQPVCTHWPQSQAQHELRSEWRMSCVRVKKKRSEEEMAEMG